MTKIGPKEAQRRALQAARATETREVASEVRATLGLPSEDDRLAERERHSAAQRPRKARKSAQATKTAANPIPPSPRRSPAAFYAPPGTCAFCDARRGYSRDAMKRKRAEAK